MFLNHSVERFILLHEYSQCLEERLGVTTTMLVMLHTRVANALLDFKEQMLPQVVLPVVLREAIVDCFEHGRVVIIKRLYAVFKRTCFAV